MHPNLTGLLWKWGLPSSSNDEDSACVVGDMGPIPESGRAPEEGYGNGACPVAQMLKILLALWENGMVSWLRKLA